MSLSGDDAGGSDAGEVPASLPDPPAGAPAPSLADLARNSTRFARAWGNLVASEAALAESDFRPIALRSRLAALPEGAVHLIDREGLR